MIRQPGEAHIAQARKGISMGTERIKSGGESAAVLRARYPQGLHFVVGDTHGEAKTLQNLMRTIAFDPERDHVYFVGDYNGGGSAQALLKYIAQFYQEDYARPGFHLIRGNHERELWPRYPLANLPDIIVYRGDVLDFYIVHAGLVAPALRLITEDMIRHPEKQALAYRLDDSCAGEDAPLRQIIWSRRGLYSQRSRWRNWPRTDELTDLGACVIHGHTPYCFFMKEYFSYGDVNLFWENEHIWFSEDLCSFDIDANIKGRAENGEHYRGLACLCLEALEETARRNGGMLTVEGIRGGPNAVFAEEYDPGRFDEPDADVSRVLLAAPEMKTITLGMDGVPVIVG